MPPSGEVSVTCDDALVKSFDYPFWGVWLDVDGDLTCGAGDLGFDIALFGWNADVIGSIDATGENHWKFEFQDVSTLDPTWSHGSFCDLYHLD